ncbi:MAG: flippase [Chitinophagales bacterium]
MDFAKQKVLQIWQNFSTDKRYILKGTLGSLILRVVANVLSFVSTIVLAHILGQSVYDDYTYLFAWFSLVGGLSLLGFDNLSLRQMARYQNKKRYDLLKGFIIVATLITCLVGTLLFFSVYIYSSLTLDNQLFTIIYLQENIKSKIWLLVFLILPFMALTQVYQHLLQGAKHIISSQIPEMIVRPIVLLCLLIGIYIYQDQQLDLETAIYLQLLAIFVAFLASVYFFWRKIIATMPAKILPTYEIEVWLKASASFFLINSISLINVRTDILMLGMMQANTEGISAYNIGVRLSEIPKLILIVTNATLAPLIASYFSAQKWKELQKMLTQTARIVWLLSLPLLMILVVFAAAILSIWGQGFVMAKSALQLLCMAQFFNLFFGSVGTVLMMTGHEKKAFIGLIISTLCNISCNYALIPKYGLNGAALATLISIFIWNFLLFLILKKTLQLDSSILGFWTFTVQSSKK